MLKTYPKEGMELVHRGAVTLCLPNPNCPLLRCAFAYASCPSFLCVVSSGLLRMCLDIVHSLEFHILHRPCYCGCHPPSRDLTAAIAYSSFCSLGVVVIVFVVFAVIVGVAAVGSAGLVVAEASVGCGAVVKVDVVVGVVMVVKVVHEVVVLW